MWTSSMKHSTDIGNPVGGFCYQDTYPDADTLDRKG